MVLLEAVPIFIGRYCGVFIHAAVSCLVLRRSHVLCSDSGDYLDYYPSADVRRFRLRMAVDGVHSFADWRAVDAQRGNFGAVSLQNISGGKKTSYLYLQRKAD